MHLVEISCKTTSSEAVRPISPNFTKNWANYIIYNIVYNIVYNIYYT